MLARLPNGTRLVIREIRPSDKVGLADALAQLSPESNHARFMSPRASFSSAELRYLTEVDGNSHAALVAVLADAPDHIVAVGRYVRLVDDPAAAEVAIVVGDPYQAQGLGRRLGLLLADRARAQGIRRFTASMLATNVAAHRLLAALTQRLTTEHHGGTDELSAELYEHDARLAA